MGFNFATEWYWASFGGEQNWTRVQVRDLLVLPREILFH